MARVVKLNGTDNFYSQLFEHPDECEANLIFGTAINENIMGDDEVNADNYDTLERIEVLTWSFDFDPSVVAAVLLPDNLSYEFGTKHTRPNSGFDGDIIGGIMIGDRVGVFDEYIDGGGGNDIINSLGGNNWVYGGRGNDKIYGSGANDLLDGGSGDDYINSDSERSIIDGGTGSDTVYLRLWGGSVADGGEDDDGSDIDTLELRANGNQVVLDLASGNGTIFSIVSDDNPVLIARNFEVLNFYGSPFADVVTGGDLADSLNGYDGNDYLFGEGGDDIISGWDGNDELRGGGGKDLLVGGAGADTIYDDKGDDRVYGGDGNDTLKTGAGNDVVWAGIGDDVIVEYGRDDPYLAGDANINDRLYGEEGNDKISGGSGNDWIDGGADNDTIVGGHGVDTMTGGSGRDTFVYEKGDMTLDKNTGLYSSYDVIRDFSKMDTLDLRGLLPYVEGGKLFFNDSDYAQGEPGELEFVAVDGGIELRIAFDRDGVDDFRLLFEGVSFGSDFPITPNNVLLML